MTDTGQDGVIGGHVLSRAEEGQNLVTDHAVALLHLTVVKRVVDHLTCQLHVEHHIVLSTVTGIRGNLGARAQ